MMEDFEEDGIFTTSCDLVEVGPLNIPDFNKFRNSLNRETNFNVFGCSTLTMWQSTQK
jgi:hypothetical protein